MLQRSGRIYSWGKTDNRLARGEEIGDKNRYDFDRRGKRKISSRWYR